MAQRKIGIVVFQNFQILDMAGPLEAFNLSTRKGGRYQVQLLAPVAGHIQSSSFLSVGPAKALADSPPEAFDTIVVAGGLGVHAQRNNTNLLTWLTSAHGKVRRIASVCSGAFLLAEAGLLDGRKAVTHWDSVPRLAREFPTINVLHDAIFTMDKGIWTSAGITAGVDLALSLIEADHGKDTALATAREMVVFLKRPGGQSQFSAELIAQEKSGSKFDHLRTWIFENLALPLDVQSLADESRMSRRNFQRLFTQSFGLTPAKFIEHARVDAARRDLEETGLKIEQIALHRGFGDAERMRRTFQRILNVTPVEYRERFTNTGQPA